MKVKAEHGECIGAGTCRDTAPTHFAIGDDGKVVVIQSEVADPDLAAVEDAVLLCPVEAIALIRAEDERG